MSSAGVSRRSVLLAGMLGASTCLSLPSSAAAAAVGSERWMGAVFDQRFPESAAFANSASRLSIRPLGFAGDMSQLWFEQLLPELQVSPRPFLGLTSERGLFCFEQLAWSIGLRVALRIDEGQTSRVVSLRTRQALSPLLLARLDSGVSTLGAGALVEALACRAAWSDCTHATPPQGGAAGAEALVAWVIAPSKTL
jgi:hypothetical protein